MPSDIADAHRWMRRALERAHDALYRSDPNPRVGCVLVKGGTVIGEGATQVPGGAHAEIEALNDAQARGFDVRGATAYVTLEPCSHFGRTPPCADALIAAGIARVVAAMQDPNPLVAGQGFERLRAAGIAVESDVLSEEMRDEAHEINIGFVSRMTTGRPWVRMKIAASLDAQSALANGQSQWITSEAARRDGHAWRARASALLTGIGTVRLDDPRLDVREWETMRDSAHGSPSAPARDPQRALVRDPMGETTREPTHGTAHRAARETSSGPLRQPLRVLVDSRFEVPVSARIVRNVIEGKRLLVVGAVVDARKQQALADVGCETLVLPNAHGKVDLVALIEELGRRDVNELHVEAGSKLNGSLICADCVDEILAYLAPCLLGRGQPMIELPPIDDLKQRQSLTYHDFARVGNDLRIRARFDRSPTGD